MEPKVKLTRSSTLEHSFLNTQPTIYKAFNWLQQNRLSAPKHIHERSIPDTQSLMLSERLVIQRKDFWEVRTCFWYLSALQRLKMRQRTALSYKANKLDIQGKKGKDSVPLKQRSLGPKKDQLVEKAAKMWIPFHFSKHIKWSPPSRKFFENLHTMEYVIFIKIKIIHSASIHKISTREVLEDYYILIIDLKSYYLCICRVKE